MSIRPPSIPLPSRLCVGALGTMLTLVACDLEAPPQDAFTTIDPADLAPADAATLAGRLPIVAPQAPADGDAAPADGDAGSLPALLRDSDGHDDPELLAFMDGVPGMVRWQPVRAGEAVDAALRRFADERPDPEEGFSYVGMVTPRGHYLIEVEDDAMMLVRDRAEMIAEGGMAGPDQEQALPPEDEASFRGWSNGIDSRQRLTGYSIPDKVGRVAVGGGQCSGALIGRRIVRTAAHCVIIHSGTGGTPAASVTFDYRRDAGSVPVSTTTSSFFYGGAYLPSGCGTSTWNDSSFGYRNNFDACTWADWAYLVLPTNWNGSTWHSWFGYKGLLGTDVGMELQSGGYPGCGFEESPAGCVNQAYYRDISYPCAVSAWTNGTAKFRSGCDISRGNSGGPVWQEGTAYLIGHVQWQDCTTCPDGTPNQAAPNHYLGHDDWLFNFQNDLRSWFP